MKSQHFEGFVYIAHLLGATSCGMTGWLFYTPALFFCFIYLYYLEVLIMFSVKQSKFRWSDGLKLYDRHSVLSKVSDVDGADSFFSNCFSVVKSEAGCIASYLGDVYDLYVGNPKFNPYLCYYNPKSDFEIGFVVKFNLYFDDRRSMDSFIDSIFIDDFTVKNTRMMGYMPSTMVFGKGFYFDRGGKVQGGVSPVGFVSDSMRVSAEDLEIVSYFLFMDKFWGKDSWLDDVLVGLGSKRRF